LSRQKKGALDDLFNEFGEIREGVDDSTLRGAQPPESGVSNSARSGGAGVAVIAVIVLAILVYFLCGIPGYGEVGGYESVPTMTPQQTPSPTVEYNLMAKEQEEPDVPEQGFFSLHTQNFESGEYVFPVSLTSPPHYINYSVVPEIVSRQKMVYSSPSDTTGELIECTYPSEDSWFEIKVTNEYGDIVIQDGFGTPPDAKSGYGRDNGHLKVFVSGDYRIEIQFNNVIVDLDIQ
jgi:hypothetical protein